MPRRGRTPTARRAPTRERLVAAATKVVARRGFHGATVDEIAEAAGFSVGAIYSNFDGKDDLFLAVFDGHVQWFEEQLEGAAAASDVARALTDWMDSLARDPEQLLVFIEFWAYAVRKPKLRRNLAARMGKFRTATAAVIERRAAATGTELPVPPDTLAVVLLAAIRGLGIETLADSGAVDGTVAKMIASLVP